MNSFWISFSGKSMHPFLRDHDELFVTPASRWKKGDIVLYKDKISGELTVHRIVTDNFQTKGDYSLCLDQNSPDEFLGKVSAFKRNGQYFSLEKTERVAALIAFFSLLRLKGPLLRKIGLAGLIFLSFCKTSADHTSVPR